MKQIIPNTILISTIVLMSSFSKIDFPKFNTSVKENNKKNDTVTRSTYTILKTSFDTTLQPQESKVIFRCISPNGGIISSSMKLHHNSDSTISRTDSSGFIYFTGTPKKYKFSLNVENDLLDEMCFDTIETRPQHTTVIEVKFAPKLFEINVQYEYDKPVIYLYPTKKTNVSLQLNFKGELTFTYPEYNNGWQVEADPNGMLIANKKSYRYLFWEGKSTNYFPEFNEKIGFLVASDTLVPFLENSLTQIGLNDIEIQDFITFWAPKMIVNKQNYIHFILNENCNEYAELNITPRPDNVIRVFMVWKPETKITINYIPQVFPKFSRKGFSAIEWGGSEILLDNL